MTNNMKDLEWFIERIGTTIYRGSNGCSCDTCKDVEMNGVKVNDKLHAEYLYEVNLEGVHYEDKPLNN